MEERKLIRRRAMKQKRGVFYRKSAATTAALVSTVNILPVSVLADTLESTEAQNGVRVVETADSSQDHSTQDTSTQDTSTQDSVIVVEDNATNDESGTQDNSDSSNVDVVGVPESEDIPERVPADDTASEQEETEIGSDIPVLSEEERIAIETKVMPNYNNPMARSTNQQAFIQQVGPMAQEVAGANDLYASVMIAQAILESGWGQSTLTTLANNMFGIKGSYNGQFVEMQTMEDDGNGNLYPIIAKFRKYPSLKESFQDNAHVLKTTSFSPGVFFYHGAWKSNTSSYRDATQWLQGRYATDTSYASKLNNLIETYNLTQYDTSSGGGSNNNNNNNNSEQAINKQFRTNAALNIRSDASTSASIVGSLAANATFQAVAQKSGTSVNGNTTWYRIQGRGWVSAAHVTEISSNTGGNGNNNNGNNNNTEQSINKEFRTTAALNIRSDASTSASVVGSLANNTTFRAVAQKTGTSVNGNNVWYRIQGRGWVSAAYVSEVSSGSNNTEQSINKEFRTTATLNIRSDASTSANIVGSLSSNASFRAVAQKTGTSVNGNNIWYRIEGRGWVSAAYVRENSTSSSSTTHTVRSGDTLWGISQRYGVTVNQLMQWNNLSGSLIVVGQRLVVSR